MLISKFEGFLRNKTPLFIFIFIYNSSFTRIIFCVHYIHTRIFYAFPCTYTSSLCTVPFAFYQQTIFRLGQFKENLPWMSFRIYLVCITRLLYTMCILLCSRVLIFAWNWNYLRLNRFHVAFNIVLCVHRLAYTCFVYHCYQEKQGWYYKWPSIRIK